jgi:outer membrane receptor protein involved in Fe transport
MSYSESIKENYIVLPTVSDGTETTTNFTTASFGYRKDFSDKVTIDASITYHKHHWWIDWSILHPDFYDYEFGKSEEFEADVTTIFKPSDKISITSGLHYSTIFHINWFDLIPSLPFNVNYILPDSIDTRSLFVQADFSPSKKLRLVAGVRFEQMLKYTLKSLDFSSMGVFPDFTIEGVYDNEKVRFIPRFALIYSLNDKNFIKFLYGKAIRHPEFQPNLENLIYSVSSLNPEDINTFELNYMTSPNSNLTINFSLFYNQLKNLIARKFEFDSTGTLITYYGNGGELETIGAEVSLLTKPFKNFLLELSGTYQNTKDKREDFKDIDVAYSPNLLIHLKASYRFGQNVTLALMGRYVDEMEPSWDTESGERIGKTVDSHFTLDANLRLNNLFKKGFYINARVTNLFDTDYLYPANENNNLWADIGVIGRGLGRAFIITLGKKW